MHSALQSTAFMDIDHYIPLLLLLLVAAYTSSRRIIHKLQNLPPSPFPSLPLIGHLYLLKKPFHRGLSEVSKRHGPILLLRFGSRPVLLVSAPSLAEECLTKNDIVFANRPSFLSGKHFGYNSTSISWLPYGDHWRNLRRIASLDLLSSHRIQMLAQIRADEIRFMIAKLFRLTSGSRDRVIFVKQVLFEFTFNALTRMVCGRRYFGETVENSGEAALFQDIINETSQIMPEANPIDFLPFLKWFRYRDTEKKMMMIQEKRDKFMQNVVEECRRLESDDSCIQDRAGERRIIAEILVSMQKTDPDYYTDEVIKNLLLILIQAGSDTSSTTLEWAFSLLLDNPNSLRKAQLEIDNLVEKKRLINESDISQLPYLYCIIKETLRLHPPAPLLLPHESSADCTVGGYRVPSGTILLVNLWNIQRNPGVWEEPEKFKPERFEDFDGGKNGCRYLPFGSGRRACPGENLAMRVVALALGSLIQCFDWEKASEIDMNEGTGFSSPKIQPLTPRCTPRPQVLDLVSQI